MMETHLFVGLMSGTSADGVDAALVEIGHEVAGRLDERSLSARLITFSKTAYPEPLRRAIFDLFRPESAAANVAAVSQANFALGEVFAQAVLDLARAAGVKPVEIAAVGSHGQTIWHQPRPATWGGMEVTSTLQIGEPAVIAERTGITVVADFRVRDMAAGGQGAPLVPYVDYLLFKDDRLTRAIQNIGGIANVTYLPAEGGAATGSPDRVIAFDTGPGNMVIDGVVKALSAGRETMDRDGRWAASGRVQAGFLADLLTHPYFAARPPKTTGREEFGEQYAAKVVAEAAARGLGAGDTVATVTALTARTIGDAYKTFLPALPDQVILGGGGARNPTLRSRLQDELPGIAVTSHEAFGIPDEAKEAMAFAILAGECLDGEPNNLPSATGARRPVVMGKIVPGRKRRASGEMMSETTC